MVDIMDTPTKDDGNPAFLWNQLLSPSSHSSTSQTSPISTPTLSLWSRKLSLQSEELNSLIQKSTTKLHEHQQHLTDLLKTYKDDLTNTKHELEAVSKKRDGEVDTQLVTLRRITQTTTDLLYALEAKLSLLETLHTVHQKLQSHDLLLRDLVQGQKQLLTEQKRITGVQEKMAVNQEGQGNMLKDIIHVLSGMQKVNGKAAVDTRSEIQQSFEAGAFARAPVTMQVKRPRRLLSDEELLAEEAMFQREPSMELMSIGEVQQVRERTVSDCIGKTTEANHGRGGVALERPLKRKLLSTMDVEQFADDF